MYDGCSHRASRRTNSSSTRVRLASFKQLEVPSSLDNQLGLKETARRLKGSVYYVYIKDDITQDLLCQSRHELWINAVMSVVVLSERTANQLRVASDRHE